METVIYRCPNCGAPLEFNVQTQNFDCKFCNSNFSHNDIVQIFSENENNPLDLPEPEIVNESDLAEFCDNTSLYECPSCGAQVIADSLTSSTHCHFCHTPVILTGRLSGDFRPSKMIPFKITREMALEAFNALTAKKWFLPKTFRTEATLNEMSGLYVPFWLSDSLVNVNITAKCEKKTTWRSGDMIHTHTKVFDVVRDADIMYNSVPADGSKRIDDALMESIEPYDYKEMVPFSMSYLSGHVAEKYDVGKDETIERVKKRTELAAFNNIKSKIGDYSVVNVTSSQNNTKSIQLEYALLPVWFLTYKYKGKDFYYAVNGQTGKMSGTLPIWWSKLLAVAISTGLAAAAIITIVGGFLR